MRIVYHAADSNVRLLASNAGVVSYRSAIAVGVTQAVVYHAVRHTYLRCHLCERLPAGVEGHIPLNQRPTGGTEVRKRLRLLQRQDVLIRLNAVMVAGFSTVYQK